MRRLGTEESDFSKFLADAKEHDDKPNECDPTEAKEPKHEYPNHELA